MIRHLTMILFALLPFTGWAQQKNYNGQHVSIKQTTGDSIQYDLRLSWKSFKPIVKNGKIEWQFNGNTDFTLENVESIDFRSFEYDEREVRKALIEFYNEMGGDSWVRKDNWCSNKPIWEWYGINGNDGVNLGQELPWVSNLWLLSNNLSGQIPDCMQRMGPIQLIACANHGLDGGIPKSLGNIYSLGTLLLYNNGLTGSVPAEIGKIPELNSVNFEFNNLSGHLPEEFIIGCLDNKVMSPNQLVLWKNDFNGKVPQSVQEHERFALAWPHMLIQNNPLDVSDLTIPAPVFTAKDIKGKTINLGDIYKNNEYTLVYIWNLNDMDSKTFNVKLSTAYNAYKEKGFEVVGLHFDMTEDDGLAEYVENNDIPWNNCNRKNLDYDVQNFIMTFVPWYMLVDKNGKVVLNSLMDEEGNNKMNTSYINTIFSYLENLWGKIDYNFYTSSDYSRDGEVATLQTANIDNGIDMVFVGEGFTDKDIEEGIFDQRMYEALEQFFVYEPYKSLRDRFNVYGVKAVSPNAEFLFGECKHAIDEDISKALEYASKVPDLIPDHPMHVVVVYNNNSGGRSYCTMMEDDSFVCFTMDGVSTVLNHEAGGHGIGKLLDEYVEQGNESLSLPEENKTYLENVWTDLGWGANVDWHSDPKEVRWGNFINDERYIDEQIGLYEGSYLYAHGAYRPTENSMMRYNDIGFNAPSREEIYKRVMKESEGDSWTYDYETFVAFDAAGHTQFVNNLNGASMARGEKAPEVQPILRTAPPVFMKGTWRDALKKDKK